jgi:hypothetical protein
MLNVLAYLIIFLIASWGSSFIMRKRGYPKPQSLSNRVDRILALMHLIWFVIISMLLLSLWLVFTMPS